MNEVEFTTEYIETLLRNLRRNNMEARYIPHREDVRNVVASLLHHGDRIAVGGSLTLKETGVLDLIRGGDYNFIDRYETGLSQAEHKERLLDAMRADVFLCSANAITQNGEIYQVDGLSNRIAPLVYGPDNVILVAGTNKIVRDIEAAVERVRSVTAPAIVKRSGLNAPCGRLGRCIAQDDPDMAAGCRCDDRRCCNYLVLGRQRIKGRIKLLLVGDTLGF